MRALRFEKTGSLDELTICEMAVPTPAPGEVLVQVKAAAVNPSDVKSVQGRMHVTTVPRVPGRDFAGVIVGGSVERSGHAIFGSGGDLGFGRDGSHAQYVTVPAGAVLPLPKDLTFEQAAGVGVAYLTAWTALVNAAAIQPGETALILGTAGAVGSAAAHIAHRFGAQVIGTARTASDIPSAGVLPVDAWIDLEATELGAGVHAITNGRGADVVFDVVGGAMFEPCLAALARRGRQVAISSNPGPRVSFNLVDFYHNESRLLGVDTLKLSFEETARILFQITPEFEAGRFPPPRVQAFPLEEGPKVYRDLAEFKLKTKPVLVP